MSSIYTTPIDSIANERHIHNLQISLKNMESIPMSGTNLHQISLLSLRSEPVQLCVPSVCEILLLLPFRHISSADGKPKNRGPV